MKGVRVFLEEEYGYRHWVWRTGLTERELISWWSSQEVMTDSNLDYLPGELKEVTLEEVSHQSFSFHAHIHMNDDSYLKLPSGEKVFHAGYNREEEDD